MTPGDLSPSQQPIPTRCQSNSWTCSVARRRLVPARTGSVAISSGPRRLTLQGKTRQGPAGDWPSNWRVCAVVAATISPLVAVSCGRGTASRTKSDGPNGRPRKKSRHQRDRPSLFALGFQSLADCGLTALESETQRDTYSTEVKTSTCKLYPCVAPHILPSGFTRVLPRARVPFGCVN
jgi:hypothetical protein